ncbi:hypothetical protein VNO77_05635 [Canavalia gladiata]|uniref:Uncharacterized protein n=1 Tax=Canavalia gladiata TaxID=3824 RepID=A0AAN9N0S7_CANGL
MSLEPDILFKSMLLYTFKRKEEKKLEFLNSEVECQALLRAQEHEEKGKGKSQDRMHVKAQGSALLNPHSSMADFQQQLNALRGLASVLNGIDEDEIENGTPHSPHDPAPVCARNRSFGKYNNTGNQKIKGLSNQTGFTEGNANGAINFGNLRVMTYSSQSYLSIIADRNHSR